MVIKRDWWYNYISYQSRYVLCLFLSTIAMFRCKYIICGIFQRTRCSNYSHFASRQLTEWSSMSGILRHCWLVGQSASSDLANENIRFVFTVRLVIRPLAGSAQKHDKYNIHNWPISITTEELTHKITFLYLNCLEYESL